MILSAMLILAFGPLDWAFPWWLWMLAIGLPVLRSAYADHQRNPGGR